MTNSAFVLDWSRPVPLNEFFLPLTDVTMPSYRACTQMKELRCLRWRILRQETAVDNDQWFSGARDLDPNLLPVPTLHVSLTPIKKFTCTPALRCLLRRPATGSGFDRPCTVPAIQYCRSDVLSVPAMQPTLLTPCSRSQYQL